MKVSLTFLALTSIIKAKSGTVIPQIPQVTGISQINVFTVIGGPTSKTIIAIY